jgi:tetratricopeptide (TPR) repeat protein
MNVTRYRPGEILGARFEIIEAIRGGVGEVYRCIDRQIDKPFALKRLQTRYASIPRFHEAFRREAQTWIEIGRHPNIVPCVVLQEFYNEPFLVLPWIFGPDGSEPDLGKRMRGQPMALRPAIEIAIDVARGLKDAALRVPSIVHCDLKPANILIGSGGEALITDFGMAKSAIDAKIDAPDDVSQPDREFNPAIGGTPRYMAPEQWTGGEVDARTDVYALACVLFEALSGHAVYLGPKLEDFRRQHVQARIPTLDRQATAAEAQFDNLLLQCLAKDKDARPTPVELLSSLTNIYQFLYNRQPPERTLASSPTAREFQNRAVTFHSLGRSAEAVDLFRKALELEPAYALARTNLAAALTTLGRHDEALSELDRAIADDPSSAEPHVNRAAVYLDRKQLSEALVDCDRAVEKNPKLASAYSSRARTRRQMGRPQEALADIESAVRIDPLNGADLLVQGELLRELGRPDDALASISRAIEVGGGNAMAYMQRGLEYFARAEDSRAIEDLTAALGHDPKLFPAYVLRGHAQGHLWQATRNPLWRGAAVEDYSRAIELDPGRSYAAYLERGKLYSEAYQEDVAIADFTRAIEVNPGGLDAYLQRAFAYLDASEFEKAADDIEHALKTGPASYDALLALGDAHRGAGRRNKALSAYARAIKVSADRSEAYLHRAEFRLALDQAREALRDVDQAVALHPNWDKAYRARSAIHQALGNSEAAAKDMASAITASMRITTIPIPQARGDAITIANVEQPEVPDPDDTIPEIDVTAISTGRSELRLRAEGLFANKRYAEAVTAYDRAIEAGEASAEVYNWRGLAKVRTGDPSGGIEDYNRAIEAEPSVAMSYNNRGTARCALGQIQAAIADFDKAIELYPGYAMAYINRGGAYIENKQSEQGLADLAKGIELAPDQPEGYADRGAVYANLKRFDEAIADLQRALEISPNYAACHYSLGVLLVNRGDVGEGLHSLERAATLGMPQAPEAVEKARKMKSAN